MYYGYHRTSTKEQHLDRGIYEIEKFCKDQGLLLKKIYTDQHTGKTFERPRYTVMKEDVLRSGDCLIVTEVDRLGRNKKSTLKELQYYKEKGIRVMILEIPTTLMDFSGIGNDLAHMILETINNMLIEMYATLAQAEMEKRTKRQQEGIVAMKERGEWDKYGRKRCISMEEFEKAYKEVEEGLLTGTALARKLDVSPATFYRYLKELKEKRGREQ